MYGVCFGGLALTSLLRGQGFLFAVMPVVRWKIFIPLVNILTSLTLNIHLVKQFAIQFAPLCKEDAMQLLSMAIGVFGCFLLYFSPAIGLLALIVGAVLFLGDVRRKRAALEARRHMELLAAVRDGKRI